MLAGCRWKHLLRPCSSHWGMKLRQQHLDITAINTVNCKFKPTAPIVSEHKADRYLFKRRMKKNIIYHLVYGFSYHPVFPFFPPHLIPSPPRLICLFLIPKQNAKNLNRSAPVLNPKAHAVLTALRDIRTSLERIWVVRRVILHGKTLRRRPTLCFNNSIRNGSP